MGSVGIGEFLVMVFVAIVAVGPDRLPAVAREAAKVIRTLRGVADDLRNDLRREIGLDETAELFRAHGFTEVKPSLTLTGTLPPPAPRTPSESERPPAGDPVASTVNLDPSAPLTPDVAETSAQLAQEA